jgi:glycosyltransferase involved in cell wall biosynthesis
MRVAVVDADLPYPPTSGKRLRTLHLMLRLAERHEITYIGRRQVITDDAARAGEFLRDHHIEPILVDDPLPRKKGLGFFGRLLANCCSPWPYSVASHQSTAMRQAIAAYASSHAVDLLQIEWSAYVPMLNRAISEPRLLIAHNVDALIWQRFHETARGLARRTFLKEQWRKFDRFERWAFQQVSGVVAVSSEDAALIRNRYEQPNVSVVDNGIDRAYFESIVGRRDPRRILFLGALDWRPNQDAVALLLDTIFPDVLAHVPDARLVLVGRNPPEGLLRRAQETPNVEIHADVPDVRPYLATSGVMAVPLRIGGGSRLKILEALAAGLPVVSSRVGAEGLCLQPGEHYTQAEENEMAAALVGVVRQPELAQQTAAKGRELVLETYDWETLAKKLESVWEQTALAHRHTRIDPCSSHT